MSDFLTAFNRTMNFEGKELENVTGDPGGETFWGISRANFPSWDGWLLIDKNPHNVTLPDLVQDFYETVFWNRDKLSGLNSQQLANQVFDAHVNLGGKVIKVLQTLVGVEPDGIMGQETIYACNLQEEDKIVSGFIGWRKLYYQNIVNDHLAMAKFLAGWLNRCVLT